MLSIYIYRPWNVLQHHFGARNVSCKTFCVSCKPFKLAFRAKRVKCFERNVYQMHSELTQFHFFKIVPEFYISPNCLWLAKHLLMYTHENKSRKITFLSLKKLYSYYMYVWTNKRKLLDRRLLIKFFYDVSVTVLY